MCWLLWSWKTIVFVQGDWEDESNERGTCPAEQSRATLGCEVCCPKFRAEAEVVMRYMVTFA